jgi:hypothetical protein
MKTHDVAKVLAQLAKLLKTGPNVELDHLTSLPELGLNRPQSRDEALIGLSTWVNLAKIDKQQWIGIIKDNDLPIEMRPRDASRDILGKLLTYLDQNPEARKRVSESAKQRSSSVSPELTRALSILLKE